MNRKPSFNITIDKQLLDEVDRRRREEIVKQQKDISRSAYVAQLIAAGLKK